MSFISWTFPVFFAAVLVGLAVLRTRETRHVFLLVASVVFYAAGTPVHLLVLAIPAGGVPQLVDSIEVRHVGGASSRIGFKSYEQGREKWQGETLDWVWFDEEPPEDIYTEGLTRTNATGGMVWLTFTPLEGMSRVVHAFVEDVGGLR